MSKRTVSPARQAIAPFTLALAFSLSVGSAAAQDWKAKWNETLAAAKKEGIVSMSVVANRVMNGFLREQWAKDHPDIKLQLSTQNSAKFIIRLKQERSAGKHLWDTMINGTSATYRMYRQGLLDPLRPEFILPDIADPDTWGGWDTAFFDAPKKYTLAFGAYLKTPFFNAKMVPPEKIKAMGVKILLDPAYKGKIYWHDPSVRGSGRSFSFFLRRKLGDDGLKKLVQEQDVTFLSTQNEMVAAMARGKSAIGIGPAFSSLLQEYTKAGLKLDVRPFGNSPDVAEMAPGAFGLAVVNQRPHPNATRVFVNWFLSKETMNGFAKAVNLTMRRQDIPSPEGPVLTPVKGAKYTQGQIETFAKQTIAAIKYVGQLRGK